MQIQLNFETDKDSVDDLKKVCAILQEIIKRRENRMSVSEIDICNAKYNDNAQYSAPSYQQPVQPQAYPPQQQACPQQMQQPYPQQYQQPVQQPQPKKEIRTAGGSRFMPYEDMSATMANIFSGKKERRY